MKPHVPALGGRISTTPIMTRHFLMMTGSQVKAAELRKTTLSCRKATQRGCRFCVEESSADENDNEVDIVERRMTPSLVSLSHIDSDDAEQMCLDSPL